MTRWAWLGGLWLGVALTLLPQCAFAQAPTQAPALSFRSRSFINPFPQSDRYYLHVFGDGMAEGLAGGLQQAFEKDNTLRIVSSARASLGLARPDRANWAAEIDELVKAQPMHIAVIMMGTNDVRSIPGERGSIRWGTDEWRDAYAKEIDKLIKVFKDRGIAVYWVGLPVMADQKVSDNMNIINTIVRERSYIGNIKFIDSWNGFIDQSGGYSAFGPDLNGQNQRLREGDGMSFTPRGNRKLASYVETMVRRDLNEARSERNIPLAGDEDEQSQLISTAPDAAGEAGNASAPPPVANTPNPKDPTKPKTPATAPVAPVPPLGAAKGVPAPPLASPPGTPATQLSFRPGDAPPGETILGDTDVGVTSLVTVSPMADLNASIDVGERNLPVGERLYYKALVKGEALKSKPDRADDFKWPRS